MLMGLIASSVVSTPSSFAGWCWGTFPSSRQTREAPYSDEVMIAVDHPLVNFLSADLRHSQSRRLLVGGMLCFAGVFHWRRRRIRGRCL